MQSMYFTNGADYTNTRGGRAYFVLYVAIYYVVGCIIVDTVLHD